MSTTTMKRYRWFWPWQDEKEEAWLEKMSQEGKHLLSLHLPCGYVFRVGLPQHYTYRLDYMPAEKARFAEYLQLFRDAGWEYIGEMSNWRYWRKLSKAGEAAEIFTDWESKISKYRRLLIYMGFFLAFMVFLGSRFILNPVPYDFTMVSIIYLVGKVLYAVVITLYLVVVVQLLHRISQLKKKTF